MNYYEMLLARKLAKGELPPNAYLLKTASGSLVSFDDGADLPMPSFVCKIEAVQSGSGDPSPENVRPISGHTGLDAWVRGKNLLPLTLDNVKALNTAGTWDGNTYTHPSGPSGVTFTFTANNDGSITSIKADGTSPSSNVTLYLQQNITNSTYPNEMTVSGCPSGGGSSTYMVRCQMQPSPNTTIADDFGNGANFTIPNDGKNYQVIIRIQSGVTVSNLMFYPMIRLATETDATFAPYNPNSQTIQVSWQTEAGEVFGGYVDLVSGVLTVTHHKKQLTRDMDWSKSSAGYNAFYVTGAKISPARKEGTAAICNIAKYSRGSEYTSKPWYLTRDGSLGMSTDENIIGGTTIDNWKDYISNNTVEICYELETPITYQLTPTQIKSLLGNNNAWCSIGDVTLEYFGKGDA